MEEQELEISLQEIIMSLWCKAWLIALCLVMGGGIGFGVSQYLIDPTYSSQVSMYVNNNKDRSDTVLNINDLNVSQKLVTTYIEILKSEVVLGEVIQQMALDYTPKELKEMISARSVNSTEILEVIVISKNPEEAAAIANKLAEVAPPQIIRVVQAGDVQLIDEAVINLKPVAPNAKLNTLIGAMIGTVLAAGVILVLAMLDISVKSEEDLSKRYDLPILGVIPDLTDAVRNDRK